jgi:hypothetical protein
MVSVSPKTIRGMIQRGELTAHRFGRVLRIDSEQARGETLYWPAEMRTDVAPGRQRPGPVVGEFSRRAREQM